MQVFRKTLERAVRKTSKPGNTFVVQKNRTNNFHYDFSIEVNGVLKSWSVPKGPSQNPSVQRVAIANEDHQIDFDSAALEVSEKPDFASDGNVVWDEGTYDPANGEVAEALSKGELRLELKGRKLKGAWLLTRTSGRNWLLIKHGVNGGGLSRLAGTQLSGNVSAGLTTDSSKIGETPMNIRRRLRADRPPPSSNRKYRYHQ